MVSYESLILIKKDATWHKLILSRIYINFRYSPFVGSYIA